MTSICFETSSPNQDTVLSNPASSKAEQATTKLERRRLIEDLLENKRLQQELGDFDML